MEYQKAADVLKNLLDKHPLTEEEKEAVRTALGLLTLGAISKNQLKSRLQSRKAERDKELDW